jgi:hypothetical protein
MNRPPVCRCRRIFFGKTVRQRHWIFNWFLSMEKTGCRLPYAAPAASLLPHHRLARRDPAVGTDSQIAGLNRVIVDHPTGNEPLRFSPRELGFAREDADDIELQFLFASVDIELTSETPIALVADYEGDGPRFERGARTVGIEHHLVRGSGPRPAEIRISRLGRNGQTKKRHDGARYGEQAKGRMTRGSRLAEATFLPTIATLVAVSVHGRILGLDLRHQAIFPAQY